MLSCKEATRLASQALERRLTLRERIQFRLHVLICVGCRRAARQFLILRGMLGTWQPGRD